MKTERATSKDIIAAIMSGADLDATQARNALEAVVAAVTHVLKDGDAVTITHLGKFRVSKRKSYIAGGIDIPACRSVTFTMAAYLRDLMNGTQVAESDAERQQ